MAEIHIGNKICFLPIHGTIQIPKSLHQIQWFWFHLVSLGKLARNKNFILAVLLFLFYFL